MALTVGDIVRISPSLTDYLGGQEITTWDVKITTVGSGGNVGFAEDARDWIVGLYAAIEDDMRSDSVLGDINFYHRTGTEVILPTAWVGNTFTEVTEPLPTALSAMLIGRSTRRGTVARKFLPVMSEAANDSGRVIASVLTHMTTMCATWQAPIVGGNGWELVGVVWSTAQNQAYDLLYTFPSAKWAVQRRRREGRGS